MAHIFQGSSGPPQTEKQYYDKRRGAMDLERESFIPHYMELSEFIRPRRGRFFMQDRNKGLKKHNSIINSKATQAHRTAVSGMMAGTMSPTRPWFALETQNPDMMEEQEVKVWLWKTELILRAILNQSNFYSQAANLLSELILFGTAAMSHQDDFDDVARFYTHTAGSYYIAQNDKFAVDTLVREFQWTAGQIVQAFGLGQVSTQLKSAVDRNDFDTWFDVVHFIEPNKDFRPESPFAENKKFKSIYYEPGQDNLEDKFLSRSGFDEFPAYVPRWDVTGEDIYGTDCPGMTSLGDVRGLQIEEKRKAQAIDKMVNPPLHGPASIRGVPVNSLPGGLTIYDDTIGTHTLKPIYEVKPQLQDLRADIDAVERRIDTAFFVDLFLAITNIEGIQPRNQLDLIQRNEERLLQLGPVLERLQGEFLDLLIDRVFNQSVRAGILPPIPDVLSGRKLNVKYISTLALAQRAVASGNIERLALFTGSLAEMGFTGAAQKFNAEQAVDEMARAIGSPPTLVVPDDEVQALREEEAAIRKQQEQMAMAQQAAKVAETASKASLEDDNVLSQALSEEV